MKKLLLLTLAMFLLPVVTHSVAGQDQTRSERRQDQYLKTAELVESGNFTFRAQRAYPLSGKTVDLTTNPGHIEVTDEKAEADLPFFGRAYNIEYGGRGGIEFSGEIENEEISKHPEKREIIYSFEVSDNGLHRVTMDIGYDGNTTVSVLSHERSHISYHGNIMLSEK